MAGPVHHSGHGRGQGGGWGWRTSWWVTEPSPSRAPPPPVATARRALAGDGRSTDLLGLTAQLRVRTEDVRELGLPDGSVDVVLSVLCLHNSRTKKIAGLVARLIGRVLVERRRHFVRADVLELHVRSEGAELLGRAADLSATSCEPLTPRHVLSHHLGAAG